MLNYGGQHNTVSMHYNDWCPGRNDYNIICIIIKCDNNFQLIANQYFFYITFILFRSTTTTTTTTTVAAAATTILIDLTLSFSLFYVYNPLSIDSKPPQKSNNNNNNNNMSKNK
ncbi:hypothetical protein BLOT_000775 [Blomia tropicalis]|nr:hypothetical protein BLOT_000775 [Blomia tropicalis]